MTTPTFTSEGNIYYSEGTTVILAPGNYAVTDADGNTYYAAHVSGISLPYSYGFENNDLALEGWMQVNGSSGISGGWGQTVAPYEGDCFLLFYPYKVGYMTVMSVAPSRTTSTTVAPSTAPPSPPA